MRPVPRIAADSVGKPVGRLQEAFGQPRKIDTTPTKEVYVWFLPQKPAGAPGGFHGCEMEVTVDARSEHVLGYSLSNIGWSQMPRGGAQDPGRRALDPPLPPRLRSPTMAASAAARLSGVHRVVDVSFCPSPCRSA